MDERLRELPGWRIEGESLRARFSTGSFVRGVEFINAITEAAEAAGHHPDVELSFPQVSISLTTHDADGLTDKDFDLAQAITRIAAEQDIEIDGAD